MLTLAFKLKPMFKALEVLAVVIPAILKVRRLWK